MANTSGKVESPWYRQGVAGSVYNAGEGLYNTGRGFAASLEGTSMGRAAKRGVGMSFGMGYEGEKSTGFLGLRSEAASRRYNRYRARGAGRISSYVTSQVDVARVGMRKMGRSSAKEAGKMLFKGAGRFAGAAFPGAFTAYAIYSGYQEGGVMGALQEGAMSVATMAAWEMGMTALGGAAVPLAVAAGAGYAGYKFADAAAQYGRGLKKLNMGAPVTDMFGTVATTRQRSLQALQNTHINGRMALGNEGMLMHTNIYSR